MEAMFEGSVIPGLVEGGPQQGPSLFGMNLFDMSRSALVGFGAGSQIMQGRMEQQNLKFQAEQQELQAQNAILNAKKEATFIQRKLLEDLASQNASFAARGVSPTSASALAVAGRAASNATRDVEAARFGGRMRAVQARGSAAMSRFQGRQARIGSFAQAASTLTRLF